MSDIPLTVGPSINGVLTTSFRFEVLDNDENLVRSLRSVQPGGELSWHAYASVKGGGSFNLTDVGVDIDWLNSRVRPVMLREIAGQSSEIPLGVFMPSVPVENWSALGRSWTVELHDKNSILDGDVVTAPDSTAISFSVPSGTNIIATIGQIINDAGELTTAIEYDPKVTTRPMVWPPESTRLQIINDLLDAGGFFSLWCDGLGQYRVDTYVEPKDRVPFFLNETPFSHGENSLMDPEWSLANDIYAVPNRFICIGQGDADTPALMSTAVNHDPNSPFSYENRGNRWITRTDTGVEAVDQASLDSITRRRLADATSVTQGISFQHLFLPDLRPNSVVRFENAPAGMDVLCTILNMSLPFDPFGLVSSELRVVGPTILTETP